MLLGLSFETLQPKHMVKISAGCTNMFKYGFLMFCFFLR